MRFDHLRHSTRHAAKGAVLPDTTLAEHDDLGQANETAEQALDATFARPATPTATESDDDDPQARSPAIRAGPRLSQRDARAAEVRRVYFDHWIGVLDKAQSAPEARQSTMILRGALKDVQNAQADTPALAPSAQDKRILEMAGSDGLPYRTVAHWLRLRRVCQDAVAPLTPSQLNYWQPWLRFAPDQASARWTEQVENANQAAGAAALTLPQLRLLTEHPEWSDGWVRCEAIRQALERPAPTRSDSASAAKRDDTPAPDDTPAQRAGEPTPPRATPPLKPIYGSHFGVQTTLAERLGDALALPVVMGLRVGSAFLARSQQQLQHFRQHLPKYLVAECETALARLETSAEPLQGLAADAPSVRQQAIDTAYTDYDRLADAWTRCARWHAERKTPWHPTGEQVQRLRQCCEAIPHDGRFAKSLAQQAEQLLQALQRWMDRLTAPGRVRQAEATAPSA